MTFNKSRVYTALNADELKAGYKVYVSDNMYYLRECVEESLEPSILTRVLSEKEPKRFCIDDKSNEKWNNSEKDRANNALELVKKHLGNGDYAYNLMDKISNNIYMVVVLDNNTREVIGYYYSDIEKNIVVKEE